MWRRVLYVICATSIATPVDAAEWWWVSAAGEKPTRQIEFMDKTSITKDYAGRLSAWGFEIKEIPDKSGVRKDKTLYRFDCNKRTLTILGWVNYGNNDRLISSYSLKSYEQNEQSVVPESIGESKWAFVCEGKSASSTALLGIPEEFAAFYFKSTN